MKIELSKEDAAFYNKLELAGTKHDMFEWAYTLGEIEAAKKTLENIQEFSRKFHACKHIANVHTEECPDNDGNA